MLLAGLFQQFFQTFCDRNDTIRLLNELESEQWSPVLTVAVTHHLQSNRQINRKSMLF
jgi:hypothetical protein